MEENDDKPKTTWGQLGRLRSEREFDLREARRMAHFAREAAENGQFATANSFAAVARALAAVALADTMDNRIFP